MMEDDIDRALAAKDARIAELEANMRTRDEQLTRARFAQRDAEIALEAEKAARVKAEAEADWAEAALLFVSPNFLLHDANCNWACFDRAPCHCELDVVDAVVEAIRARGSDHVGQPAVATGEKSENGAEKAVLITPTRGGGA